LFLVFVAWVGPKVAIAADKAGRRSRAISYHFAPGQTFGYSVTIDVEGPNQSERFAGTPVFSVKSVDSRHGAELFAVAKLSCTARLRSSEGDGEQSKRAFWIGSVVKVSASGTVGGKADYNDAALPDFLTTLVKPKELIFTELPVSATGSHTKEGPAWLWPKPSGGQGLGSGSALPVGPMVKMIDGRETRVLRASLQSNSVVRIHRERAFRGKEAPAMSLRFVSDSLFDRDRGLVLETTATCTSDPAGGSKPTEVKISVRLLEGETLKRAISQANADWTGRPQELDPIELRRVRLNVTDLPRFQSPREARPGMVVAYFSDDDNRCYLAEVVEVVSEKHYEVRIRYRGSQEVVVVHSAKLAIPPPDQVSTK
jgi:hypothetical protein